MKVRKYGLLTLLTAILLLALAPMGPAQAATERTCGDFTYVVLENGAAEITKYNGKREKLDIPAELDGYPVRLIGECAFESCTSLESIAIPDGVTSIGNIAFGGCTSLTSINIPNSLTFIGVNPFMVCSKLKNITVSPSHPYFATIDGVLFTKADKRLICYPCCYTNEVYEIPQGVKEIGNWAFVSCESLTSITIPDSVISIGDNPFICCSNLKNIMVSPNHPYFATIDGVLFSKVDKRLICYPYCYTNEIYEIPQGIKEIGANAFFWCNSLTFLTIPNSVTSIGNAAFSSCESLTSITIPNSVTFIGFNAFYSCDSLASLTIPDSVMHIGDNAFYSCVSLTSLTIPDSVTHIGHGAFSDCPNLTLILASDYAEAYAKENNLPFRYIENTDWLTAD